MALSSIAAYKVWASISVSTHDTALGEIIAEVSDAIKRRLGRDIEQATYTEYYDAPPTDTISLRQWPVISVTSVHVASGSNGDPSLFTVDTAKVAYTDYILDIDRSDGTSTGRLLRTNGQRWGYRTRYEGWGSLAATPAPDPRAVKVVYVGGYAPVPESIRAAVHLATSLLFKRRVAGAPLTSESWNGYSSAWAGPFTATGVLDSPDVSAFLAPFMQIFTARP